MAKTVAVDKRTYNGVVFDSEQEMCRYKTLERMLTAGQISDLKFHDCSFDILIVDHTGEKSVVLMSYEPDFTYVTNVIIEWKRNLRTKVAVWNPGDRVYEDYKGQRTRGFALKAKAVKIQHNVIIYETVLANIDPDLRPSKPYKRRSSRFAKK